MITTELFGLLAHKTLTAEMDISVQITCGLTMANMSQEEDAGSFQFAQVQELGTCLMAEKFSGSATLTPMQLLMAYLLLTG